MDKSDIAFPERFLWGSALSAHQAEGGNRNDWSEWEKKNAERLAREAKKKFGHLSSWERVGAEAQKPANYVSGKASDHFRRFRDDFSFAKELHQNAVRFSIEWSRIEPEEGAFSEPAIAHYADVFHFLRAIGLEPFVTLWHWPLPLWVVKKGGWTNRETTKYFLRYVAYIADIFKQSVRFWITINEPTVYAPLSFLKGEWPPAHHSVVNYRRVLSNLSRAHREAFREIKRIQPEGAVGTAQSLTFFDAHRQDGWDMLLKKIAEHFQYEFLEETRKEHDFIGVNYYFHNRIRGWFHRNENKYMSDMGWELYPEGLYCILRDVSARFKKPIYITEHGLADGRDLFRAWYICESLRCAHRALEEGSDLRGYFHWSLLDNFEWDKGFWPRFGLLEVDYSTYERHVRPSAHFYADICAQNGITGALLEKHAALFKGV